MHSERGSLRHAEISISDIDVKGGEINDILPSMPKGEIVGNMAITEMVQNVKVVIDGNLLVMEHTRRIGRWSRSRGRWLVDLRLGRSLSKSKLSSK